MRANLRWALIVCFLIGVGLVWAKTDAFAQCPPGTHWSNRYWQCVRDRVPPPPPPPPAQCPPGTHWSGRYGQCVRNTPPPPPPPRVHGCNRSYQNCLMVCAGVPQCVQNCNIGYNACRQERRGW